MVPFCLSFLRTSWINSNFVSVVILRWWTNTCIDIATVATGFPPSRSPYWILAIKVRCCAPRSEGGLIGKTFLQKLKRMLSFLPFALGEQNVLNGWKLFLVNSFTMQVVINVCESKCILNLTATCLVVCKLIYLYSLWENVFSLCRTDKIENIQSIDIAKKKRKENLRKSQWNS